MERRLLIVFALTFLVIMLFQPLLKKYGPQPTAKQEQPATQNPAAQLPAANAQPNSPKQMQRYVAPGIQVTQKSAP